jgi:hypothetical protein
MMPGIVGMAGFADAELSVTDIVGPSATSTSHTFNGVKLGLDIPGRTLLVYIFGQTKPSAFNGSQVLVTNWSVGGVPVPAGTYGFFYRQGGSGSTIFAGTLSAGFQGVVGASGTISFNTAIATQCSVAVIRTKNIVNFNGVFPNSVNGNNALNTSVSTTVDLPSAATMTSGGIVNDSGITTSFTNNTKLTSFEHVAGYQCAVAASQNLSAQTGRSITFATSGAAQAIAIESNVWQ